MEKTRGLYSVGELTWKCDWKNRYWGWHQIKSSFSAILIVSVSVVATSVSVKGGY